MGLISAERLHRWKCQYCGSKDKNIVRALFRKDGDTTKNPSSNPDEVYEAVKIVTCSQCGYTMIFGHSALAVISSLNGNGVSLERSEKFVEDAHALNHNDPKCNPHNEEFLKRFKDKFKPIR